ncbi:MAG: hypothetical protein ACJ735_09355 [Actinomycetes bacterium]
MQFRVAAAVSVVALVVPLVALPSVIGRSEADTWKKLSCVDEDYGYLANHRIPAREACAPAPEWLPDHIKPPGSR